MEYLLSEELFNELFIGKDFVFLMKKVGDDYQYIRLNQAAQALLSDKALGKMLSTVTSSHNFSIIQQFYHQAIMKHAQIDYVDYAYYKSEIRKYETSVRPLTYKGDDYILAITKRFSMTVILRISFYLCALCLTMHFSQLSFYLQKGQFMK